MSQLNVPIKGFGGLGGNIPVWGFGPPQNEAPPVIVPNTGLIAGGDSFIIIEANLSNSGFADTFTGVSLNLSKWTDISSGGGSVTTGVGGLTMHTPGTAAVESVAMYNTFDVAANYACDRTIESLSPSSQVVYLAVGAVLSGNNAFWVVHLWDPQLGPIVKCYRIDNGVPTILRVAPMKGQVGVLRLQRFGGHVRAYIGAELFYDLTGWHTTVANIELSSSMSSAVPISPLTKVSAYTPSLVVTFGQELCDFAQESAGGRVVGYTPSTALPEGVEVKVHTINSNKSLGANSFIYTAPLQLTVSRNNASVVINNDSTLRDSTATLKGFRL